MGIRGWICGALLLACWGCAEPESLQPRADAGREDAGVRDAGPALHDAGVPPDSGIADAGAVGDAGATADAGPAVDAGPPWGTAIAAPPDTWTWVDFPDSACSDGSPVGIGINPSPTSSNLLVYLNGGGACWDAFTCLIAQSATLGPYSQKLFQSDLASIGSTIDRTDTQNPFRDWNFVFIPYCTGDVHAGDNVVTYTSGTTVSTFHHKGHANVQAYLTRLGPTFPAPGKVLIVGDSAGGAGATVNYASARAYWPNAKMYLINDSLPFFPPPETPPGTQSSELANWGIGPLLKQICGDACPADFSLAWAGLRERFPADRMALLGYNQDQTMSAYYETLPALFQLYLQQLGTQQLQPSNVKTFWVNGTGHTILWSWATTNTTASVNLRAWITQMISDDPQWTSAGP